MFIILTVLLVHGIHIFVHIKTYQTVPFVRARNSPEGQSRGKRLLFFFFFCLINLAVPGLSCDMWVLVP